MTARRDFFTGNMSRLIYSSVLTSDLLFRVLRLGRSITSLKSNLISLIIFGIFANVLIH